MGRLATVALAVALTAFVGCGSDEGTDGGAAEQPAAQDQGRSQVKVREQNAQVRERFRQRRKAEAPTEDEKDARRRAARFYALVGADRAGSSCALMSKEARRQSVNYARRSSSTTREWNCEKAIDLMVGRSSRSGGIDRIRRAKVIAVNAEGDHATATVRFGKGPLTSVPLVREGGEWRLGSSPTADGNW